MKRHLVWLFVASGTVLGQTLPAIDHVDASTPKDVQIQLALSAAPPEVARNAAVYVLGPAGYVKAREGSNGFNCLVDRQYLNTIEPECFDSETSATILPARMYLEAERAKGRPDEKIQSEIEAGYKSGKFRAPGRPSIIYMLSDANYVFDPSQKKVIHFPGHLMFPAPYITSKDLGSEDGSGVPYIVSPGTAEALIIVIPAKSGPAGGSEHQHN